MHIAQWTVMRVCACLQKTNEEGKVMKQLQKAKVDRVECTAVMQLWGGNIKSTAAKWVVRQSNLLAPMTMCRL